jgi:predicted metalloprotease with PDZ domain
MRLLWSRYGRDFYRGSAKGLPENAITAVIYEATGVDVALFLQRYVYGREDLPLAELLQAQGIHMLWKQGSTAPTLDVKIGKQGDDLRLATVYEHGAAHQAGLSAHDVLVAIDGIRVNASNLDRLLARYQAGDTVSVHAFRRDELHQFKVRLAAPSAQECVLSVTRAA